MWPAWVWILPRGERGVNGRNDGGRAINSRREAPASSAVRRKLLQAPACSSRGIAASAGTQAKREAGASRRGVPKQELRHEQKRTRSVKNATSPRGSVGTSEEKRRGRGASKTWRHTAERCDEGRLPAWETRSSAFGLSGVIRATGYRLGAGSAVFRVPRCHSSAKGPSRTRLRK